MLARLRHGTFYQSITTHTGTLKRMAFARHQSIEVRKTVLGAIAGPRGASMGFFRLGERKVRRAQEQRTTTDPELLVAARISERPEETGRFFADTGAPHTS